MTDPHRARHVKVILFLAGAVLLLVATVFELGRVQNVFSRKVALHAQFDDISGLVVGAPVRLAGLDIGIVQRIDFDRDLAVKKVHVVLGVDSRYLPRIRADSIAKLASKGLLGDTIVNITVGSADAPQLAAGAELRAAETSGAAEVIADVSDAVSSLRTLIGRVQAGIDAVMTEDLTRDVHRIARSTAGVVEEIQRGRGLLHALVYDPEVPAEVHGVLRNGARLVSDADDVMGRVKAIVAAVQDKPGVIHGLVYDEGGAETVRGLRRAADDLTALIAEVRGGKGLAHAVIYDRDQAELVQNLTALSRTLRRVGDGVERGEGTVGALLRDPTVYEDLKLILGRIERNKLLKTLVRYTIKQDGLSR